MKNYITKSDLAKRCSLSLIDKYCPFCDEEKPNPHYINSAPMQLYDINHIHYIEKQDDFLEDYRKLLNRRLRKIAKSNSI